MSKRSYSSSLSSASLTTTTTSRSKKQKSTIQKESWFQQIKKECGRLPKEVIQEIINYYSLLVQSDDDKKKNNNAKLMTTWYFQSEFLYANFYEYENGCGKGTTSNGKLWSFLNCSSAEIRYHMRPQRRLVTKRELSIPKDQREPLVYYHGLPLLMAVYLFHLTHVKLLSLSF